MPTAIDRSRRLTVSPAALSLLLLSLSACPSNPVGAADVGAPDTAQGLPDGGADGGGDPGPDAAAYDAGLLDAMAVPADAGAEGLADASAAGPADSAAQDPADASAAGPADAGADGPDTGPRFPAWPPVFISAFGLSLDGPVADGQDTWVELTIANPAGLAQLGSWSYSTANYTYVTVELTSGQIPFLLEAGDVLRVHGSSWTGTSDQQKADNHPGVWDLASTEPFGPSLKHGLLWLHAADGTVIDAVFYETARNQGDWLDGDALLAAQGIVAAGEWPTSLATGAVVLADADREFARLAAPNREGDSASDWQVAGTSLETYYERAAGKTGAALEAALHEIIKGHVVFPYSEVGSIFTVTDADPAIPGNVIQFYTGRTTKSDFNKEHLWAKSHGGFESDAYAGFSDLHHLRPTRPDVNSARWHLDFDEGGVPYSDSGCNIVEGYSFEPRDAVKGDVARALFYMAVRYDGDEPPMPDLGLVELIPSLLNAQGQPDNNQHTSTPRFGRLSTLLRWHQQDPPDDRERARNDVIFRDYQRNRNPFVDHPEWVAEIWGP